MIHYRQFGLLKMAKPKNRGAKESPRPPFDVRKTTPAATFFVDRAIRSPAIQSSPMLGGVLQSSESPDNNRQCVSYVGRLALESTNKHGQNWIKSGTATPSAPAVTVD
jgi:hypothetical protein